MEQLSKELIEQLRDEIINTVDSLDIVGMNSRIGELTTKSLEEDFWKFPNEAKKVMAEIDELKNTVAKAKELKSTGITLLELFTTTDDNDREGLLPDYQKLLDDYNEFQKFKYLSGKYDKNSAILSIHAGQGGTEANDWTDMLLRMYTMFCQKKGWTVTIQHMVQGTETGLSTVTILIEGRYAFGLIKNESGVHRMVRLSPFNSQNLRQTTFAGVEVIPLIEEGNEEIVIPDSDIDFKAVRASGPGGQHVNKTSSAVQIRHIPTGIVVNSSEQRSQSQNRDTAMRMLQARLWQIEEDKRVTEMARIKGEHKVAGWGNQIRNYVLHPYKLVKDLRTGIESTNPESVLNGELDEFINAEIRLNIV